MCAGPLSGVYHTWYLQTLSECRLSCGYCVGPVRYSFIHSLMVHGCWWWWWGDCHSRLLVQRDFIKCIYKPQGTVLTAKQEEELSPFLFYSFWKISVIRVILHWSQYFIKIDAWAIECSTENPFFFNCDLRAKNIVGMTLYVFKPLQASPVGQILDWKQGRTWLYDTAVKAKILGWGWWDGPVGKDACLASLVTYVLPLEEPQRQKIKPTPQSWPLTFTCTIHTYNNNSNSNSTVFLKNKVFVSLMLYKVPQV